MSTDIATAGNAASDPALAEHVAEIHKLLKRTIEGVVELGRRYTECKKIVGHGRWLPWLKEEFGVDDDRLVQICRRARRRRLCRCRWSTTPKSSTSFATSELAACFMPRSPSRRRNNSNQQRRRRSRMAGGALRARLSIS